MANKALFSTTTKAKTITNEAGGKAYAYSDKHALAQLACTNTFNGTFYTDATTSLEKVKELVNKLKNNPKFIAQVAIYARDNAYMKDMPAYLVAYLATLSEPKLFRDTFARVITNARMLRTFVQIARSGQVGKKVNLSCSSVRKAINKWFQEKTSDYIFKNSLGNDPSFKDIIKLARPKPENSEKEALYQYLTESKVQDKVHNLPLIVKQFENFKKTKEGAVPRLDFRMLDSILSKEQFKELWTNQISNGWQMVRMNLNNMQKYGVFNDKNNLQLVVNKLKDAEQIANAKVFPYQLLMAFMNTENVPFEIKEALQDAMELSINNTPEFAGKGYVCVDTSGSMTSNITGNGKVPSKARCVDVAGLFAASIMRKNKSVEIVPFDTSVKKVELNPRDSVVTNARKLALNGGGTNCACALRHINAKGGVGDYVIFISDNQSWVVNNTHGNFQTSGTEMQKEWNIFKARNPKAKLICLDLQPYTSSQVKDDTDILRIGGFSDLCWTVVSEFLEEKSKDFWVKKIETIDV